MFRLSLGAFFGLVGLAASQISAPDYTLLLIVTLASSLGGILALIGLLRTARSVRGVVATVLIGLILLNLAINAPRFFHILAQ